MQRADRVLGVMRSLQAGVHRVGPDIFGIPLVPVIRVNGDRGLSRESPL